VNTLNKQSQTADTGLVL